MFTDEDLDPIEFKSTWKKERSLQENGCQTRDLETDEKAVQSIKRKNREIQTDETIEEQIEIEDDDSPEFQEFLKYVSPLMIKELRKNLRSHAFDGYNVHWDEDSNTTTSIHTLCYPEAQDQGLEVTGISWNATGSVVGAAYGRHDHEDWCTHKSSLCTWNLDRRNLDVNKPDTVIDLACCLMCIAYHPQKPGVIVGGTFNGEVIVWDTSKEDETRIASSGIGDDSHREPVAKVQWMKDPESKGKKYNIVSVSSDGRILVWRLPSKNPVLKLVDGFILLTESLPRHIRAKAKRGDQEMGVTCISFNKEDETTFLLGSESGGVFKCSTNARGTPARRDIITSVPLKSPVTLCFNPHHGPVYAVESSPFHRHLFITCAIDTTIRIYSSLQGGEISTIEPGSGYLYSVKWSPVRPLVFAAVTETGQLLIYDLKHSRSAPVAKLYNGEKRFPIYTMQFNENQTNLIATGDSGGNICVWKLHDDFTEQNAKEKDLLDEIAGVVLET